MTNHVKRRSFLVTSAGLAGAAMLNPMRLRAAPLGASAGYSIGVQSFSLRAFDFETALKHAMEIGFAQIEFYRKHVDPFGAREATEAAKKTA